MLIISDAKKDNRGIEVGPSGWKLGERTLKPGLDLVGKM